MDVRDNKKVQTLPDDLKSIAEGMLEDKFGLPKKGEVMENRKKVSDFGAEKSPYKKVFWGEQMKTYRWTGGGGSESILDMDMTTQSNYSSSTLSIDDLRRAQEMLRSNDRHGYGLSAMEWLELSKYAFNPNMLTYELRIEGATTGRIVRRSIDSRMVNEMSDSPIHMIQKIVEHTGREYMEPFIILDPREYR